MYLKKTYKAGITIEVHKSFSARYGRAIGRGLNASPTPEAMKKYNEKMAFRKLTRLLNENFTPGDIFLNLTYKKENRPDPEQAKKNMEKFLRKLRGFFEKQKQELKYISVTAYGEKGGIHHHLVINSVDVRQIVKFWPHGAVRFEPLFDNGEYSALAWYLIQQSRRSPTGDEVISGKRWNQSKNLKRVEPTIEEVDAKTWKEELKPIAGYYIDKNSVENGVSDVTGIPYQFYRMIRIPGYKPPKKKSKKGGRKP